MAAVFHRIDLKLIDPTIRFALTKEDKKPGSGILQFLSDSTTISLLDAVKLMIMLSDNTATNLVLDHIATTHDARMAAVNDFLGAKGLGNTRVLNRLYSWETKKQTPEDIRYGIGVSTPEDMVLLLDALYHRTLADSASCTTMLDILKQQQYNEMIPRLLPVDACKYLEVAHKTGEINETKVDVGLILSDKVTIALAVFVDKHPDHREGLNNQAGLLVAHVARAVWNHFTGGSGYECPVRARDVDWNRFPGGSWAIAWVGSLRAMEHSIHTFPIMPTAALWLSFPRVSRRPQRGQT
jgi:beta-lactamase class A